MKIKHILLIIFLCGLKFFDNIQLSASNSKDEIVDKYNSLNKNFFIENKGQWDSEVRYLLKTNNYNAWITNFGVVYDYFQFHNDFLSNTVSEKGDVIVMKFENILPNNLEFQAKNEQFTKYNYFIGDDETKWAKNVSLFEEIIVKNLYSGINIRYYIDVTNGNNLRYDFELEPFANPNEIKYQIIGAEKLAINSLGELEIQTKNQVFKHTNLLAYQLDENNKKQIIDCKFNSLQNYFPKNYQENFDTVSNLVAFNVGNYDKSQNLIIDPLIYSVLLGSAELELAYGIAADSAGYVYVAGEVRSPQFPTVTGSYERNFNQGYNVAGGNNSDAFISKIDKTGKQLIFSTFLGGTFREAARYIRVDDDMNIYVSGETNSADVILPQIAFPRKSSNSYLSSIKYGWDVFVVKFNSNGSELKFSILLGGDNNDYSGGFELVKDATGIATDLVVAAKISQCSTQPLTTVDSYSGVFAGGETDCYAVIIDSAGSQIKYATFFGGNGQDEPKSLAVDNDKNIYITGNTTSQNFPTKNAYQNKMIEFCVDITKKDTIIAGKLEQINVFDTTYTNDIFLIKFDSALSKNLIYSTFIGGAKNDSVACISLDKNNCAYIAGSTFSNDYPTTENAYSRQLKADSANIFVTKFNQNGNNLDYSTSISSARQNFATGIVVDEDNNAHISGYTTSTDFPATWDAFFTDYSQFGDAIYSVFNSTGDSLIFSSFIGGNQYEYAYGLALDNISAAYICGATTSQRNFPNSMIFCDSLLGRDTMIVVKDSIWMIDTIIFNHITNKYDTIGWYEPTKYDTLYLDRNKPNLGNYDVFIYKASYKPFPGELATNINDFGAVFCPGSSLQVTVATPYGFYYSDNIFHIQLSDINGNFSPNSTIIGSLHSDKGGILTIFFPANLPAGNKYRIRAISTNPRSIGDNNGIDLDISPPYIKLDSTKIPANICVGNETKIQFSANPCFSENNIFYLLLSDTNGNFNSNADTLGISEKDSFNIIINEKIPPHENYKIRCVSTLPQISSNDLAFSIFQPSISFENIDFSNFQNLCAGENFDFEFNAANCFASDNIFYLILSDSAGNFTEHIDTVGFIASNGDFFNSTVINSKVPENIIPSEKYKIKIVSTNPKIEATVQISNSGTNFIIGKPQISTENIAGISICRDFETSLILDANNCFEAGNIFKIFIKSENNWLQIGESEPNEKAVTVTIPNDGNSIEFEYPVKIDSLTSIIIKSTKPELETAEIPIKTAFPQIKIVEHNPIELCENGDFSINYVTNGCLKDTVEVNIELSKNDEDFANPIIIGNGKIFGNSGNISAKLISEIDEFSKYFIRFIATVSNSQGNYLKSEIFQLNINPASAEISTNISELEILCSGVSFWLNFEAFGCFDINNVFSIILSDISGNFSDNSKVIGQIQSKNSGQIFVTIPIDLEESNKYRLKITSTLPATEKIFDFNILIKKPFIKIDSIGNIIKCNPQIFAKNAEIIDNINNNNEFQFKNQRKFQDSEDDLSYVSFTVSDCYGKDNIFILQMGKNGDFTNPINVDTCQWDEREFKFNLPENLGIDAYRIRIISVSPFVASEENGFDIKYEQPFASLTVAGNLTICREKSLIFSYISNSCFGEDNIFYLEMSDKSGDFANSTVLDFQSDLLQGEFNVLIPEYFDFGIGYKLRIRSTSPAEYFVQNSINFEIGAPEILTGNLHRISLARNDTLFVPFNTNCMEMEDKVFVVQLSDYKGTFNNILELGNQIGWGNNGEISAQIPVQASDGNAYRIRVVSINPPIIGNDNGKNITIFGNISGINDTVTSNSNITSEIFPNPFNEKFFISFLQENINKNIKITLTDLLGIIRKQLTVSNLEQNQVEINTVDLENGVYFLEIELQNKKINLIMMKLKI